MSGTAEHDEDVRDLVKAEKIRERIGLLDCVDECPDIKKQQAAAHAETAERHAVSGAVYR